MTDSETWCFTRRGSYTLSAQALSDLVTFMCMKMDENPWKCGISAGGWGLTSSLPPHFLNKLANLWLNLRETSRLTLTSEMIIFGVCVSCETKNDSFPKTNQTETWLFKSQSTTRDTNLVSLFWTWEELHQHCRRAARRCSSDWIYSPLNLSRGGKNVKLWYTVKYRD